MDGITSNHIEEVVFDGQILHFKENNEWYTTFLGDLHPYKIYALLK